jgi:hypothetical protein
MKTKFSDLIEQTTNQHEEVLGLDETGNAK